jgi:hypothetical protein
VQSAKLRYPGGMIFKLKALSSKPELIALSYGFALETLSFSLPFAGGDRSN